MSGQASGGVVKAWTDLPGEYIAGVDPAHAAETDMVMLMAGLDATRRGESYLAWHRYQTIAAMTDRLITTSASGFVMDGHADCAARIARQAGVSRRHAETLIDEAIALRDRLPEVADTLRDGVLSQWQIRLIISRTELIPTDDPITPALDAEIADTVRRRTGVWDRARLRDMVDRLVFRHDPDAVRQRRQDAMDQRGVWTHELPDGTAELTAVMSAENVRISAKAVAILADTVCQRDGRTQGIRRSDAMFALLTRTSFDCQCDDDEPCTADIPDPHDVLDAVRAEIVIHVVTGAATLAGAPGVGFLDEHGIISDQHVRDLAARPDATLSPVTPARTQPTYVAPQHQRRRPAADRPTPGTSRGHPSRRRHDRHPRRKRDGRSRTRSVRRDHRECRSGLPGHPPRQRIPAHHGVRRLRASPGRLLHRTRLHPFSIRLRSRPRHRIRPHRPRPRWGDVE
ncbi:protein of unknown function [Gordonia sp. v-85]|nr:protein of unknown function [Gordonia sp. v-85]